MGNDRRDPIDHARTTRQHAGETMKNGVNAPGVALSVAAVVALVLGLAAFANGRSGAGIIAVGVAAVAAVAGGCWLFLAHRRVRRSEVRWAADHPHAADAQPPAS